MAWRVFYIFLIAAALVAAAGIGKIYYNKHRISTTPDLYAKGPADADLEVVEFIDYACPFCQQIHPTIIEAVQRDGRVRYLPKPLPVLGNERSANAAIMAYAAGQQGKFFELHDIIIRDFASFDDAKAIQVMRDLGIDADQLKRDALGKQTRRMLSENGELYQSYDTGATPTFVFGGHTVYVPKGTMPTADDFLRMFNEARQKK